MRLLLTSDWHADAVTHGVPRFDEIEQAADRTVEWAIDHKVDGYFFLGDLCDPDINVYAVARSIGLAIRIALRLRRAGIPSYWMDGNHCVIEDGSGDSVLTPLRALDDGLAEPDTTGAIRVFNTPSVVPIGPLGMNAVALFLPFTATSHAYDTNATTRKLLAGCSTAKVVVVLGHLSIPGVIPGEETTDMPRGREVVFPLEALTEWREAKAGRRLVLANGHYHRRQIFESPAGPIHIPGSLARLTFGEQANRPGFLVVEV